MALGLASAFLVVHCGHPPRDLSSLFLLRSPCPFKKPCWTGPRANQEPASSTMDHVWSTKSAPLPLLCWPSPGSRLSWLCPKAVGQSPLASRFLQQEPASSPPSTAGPPVKILCGPLQTPLPRFGFERSTHPKGCRGGPELWSGSPAFPLESSLCQLVSCSLRHLTGIHSGTAKHLLSNPLILRCLLSEHTSTILVRDLHA